MAGSVLRIPTLDLHLCFFLVSAPKIVGKPKRESFLPDMPFSSPVHPTTDPENLPAFTAGKGDEEIHSFAKWYYGNELFGLVLPSFSFVWIWLVCQLSV